MNRLKIKAGETTNDIEITVDGVKMENLTNITIHPIGVNDRIMVTFTGYVSELDIDILGEFAQADK